MGNGHIFSCVSCLHNNAATTGQYLVLSKPWQFSLVYFTYWYISLNLLLKVFFLIFIKLLFDQFMRKQSELYCSFLANEKSRSKKQNSKKAYLSAEWRLWSKASVAS